MTTITPTEIIGKTFDREREFYESRSLFLTDCRFDGPADGESAMKESRDVHTKNCYFNLRYPFWHDDGVEITDCELTELCRAALWYSDNVRIDNTKMHGIKAVRECRNVSISDCDVISPEFGWFSHDIDMSSSFLRSEYFLLHSSGITMRDCTFEGKYSFQYTKNVTIENCTLNTKDAFWHAENVTVRDCVINGEYLAWYSDGLTLINCKITGTQPFCYCRNLRLIDCEMHGADLCFEKSEVDAIITTPVISIKNPGRGRIVLPSVGEIIDDAGTAEIVRTEE